MITAKNETEFLSRIIYLIGRLTGVPKDQINFVMLNETNTLVTYKSAAAFHHDKLIGLSYADKIVESSPVVQEMKDVYNTLSKYEVTIRVLENTSDNIGEYALVIPINKTVLVFTRDGENFNENEINALITLSNTYEKVLNYKEKKDLKIKKKLIIAGVSIFLLSFIPLRTSTHEKAEVDLYKNTSVKSSMNGVIKNIEVDPNQSVHKGDVLFILDDKQIKADLNVAEDELSIARTQYDAMLQQGMTGDEKSRQQVMAQKNRIQEEQDRVNYQKEMLGKTVVKSPTDGIAIYNEKYSLIGKPVSTGEKILEVSNPDSKSLKIFIPTQDIITFSEGSTVNFYDNINPLHAYKGTINYVPYQPVAKPDQTLVYEYKASLEKPDRPGLEGTAVISGKRIPLILWLFRKPLSFVRSMF